MGAHWTLATGATVVSGLILLAAVFAKGLGGKERFWAGVGGAIFTVYGLWGVNRTSGTFYYNWIVFAVPVAAIIFLAYRAYGGTKNPAPAPVARPTLPTQTVAVPRPPQNAVPARPSDPRITGGPVLPSPGGTFGGEISQHLRPSTPPTIASTESASSADMTVARSRVVVAPVASSNQNLAGMTVVRSRLVGAPDGPPGESPADMTVVRSRPMEAPEEPTGDMADAGVADMTVARSRLVGAPVRPWSEVAAHGVADMTVARSPLIAAAVRSPERIPHDATDDEKCPVCGHPVSGSAVRCARCGAPLPG